MAQVEETGEKPLSRAKDEIIKEVKRIEEDALVTSKGHFSAAHCWSFFHLCIGLPIVVLAAITGTSAMSGQEDGNILAVILSIVIAVLTSIMTFLNPNQKSSAHLNAGNNYDALKNKMRMFGSIDCWREDSEAVLTERLKNHSEQKDRLNQSSPQVPWWAFLLAKRGINKGEAIHQIDLPQKPLIK